MHGVSILLAHASLPFAAALLAVFTAVVSANRQILQRLKAKSSIPCENRVQRDQDKGDAALTMTPEEFIARWRGNTRTERAAAQHHFLELCDLLGVDKPGGPDYEFEKSTRKIGDTQGYADVWRDRCFIWEYKGDRKNLVQAYAQLKQYADAFGNPPLLIVSDMQEIRVRTNFTNAIAEEHVIPLAQLRSVEARDLLRNCFLHPERLRPDATRETVTAKAAAGFAKVALSLRQQFDERRVAHFINKLVFCLFAESEGIDLLPDRLFADLLDEAAKNPDACEGMLRQLFAAMANPRGTFGPKPIPWFNGGLFDDDDVLPLNVVALAELASAARLDWKAIDPTIFGTLFESGLDDKKRAEMASLFDAPELDRSQKRLFEAPAANRGVGIHYTDEATIMKIIDPVVMAPLRREWEDIKGQIRELDARRDKANAPAAKEKLLDEARTLYRDFRERLGKYRVLDPACGSGNFLALSLRHLKDFDLDVLDDAKPLGLPPDEFRVGPEAVLGIEINAYAAELARLTVWITELQWQLQKGHGLTRRPILDRLDGIIRADALVTPSGKERDWPEADVVVGNPPFLGTKRMYGVLGVDYTKLLRDSYRGRVSPFADLVCWWFEKARSQIAVGKLKRAGLVATNSLRGGKNRLVLDAISQAQTIFSAWSDEPWVLNGAQVRVSLVCFARTDDPITLACHLDGKAVSTIHSDLTAANDNRGGSDLTRAKRLVESRAVAFVGTVKAGAFDLGGAEARRLLGMPLNPNGRPNSDVLRRWANGLDIVRRPQDKWIIDFGVTMPERDAALYEHPFRIVVERVKPLRDRVRRPRYRDYWWLEAEPCAGMRAALQNLSRFSVTPATAKHRVFAWMDTAVQADHQLIAVARDDDTAFGILHSRFHEAWSIGLCTWLGVGNDPRYTPSTTFETFPFPEGLTPNIPASDYATDPRAIAIAAAARELDQLRNAWLNPSDLIRIEPEVVPGYPDRILPKDAAAEKILKTRTLTNLYNERPTWLANAHRDLDAAVAAAYGWPIDISEEDALARLLALNLERATQGR
jgi:type II restriction/modification system DNA methylase subunit YeeA